MRFALAAVVGAVLPAVAQASCSDITVEAVSYTICETDLTRQTLGLFHSNAEGQLLGQFSTVNDSLRTQGKQLGFAMNAGMYHADRGPVGLYVENGVQSKNIVTNAGPGNFGLLPNGVFCIRDGRADVIETLTYQANPPACIHATQSGPMLVIDGALHHRFLPDSTSRYIRNGVGTSADGTKAVFAISNQPVTFHEFGKLFQTTLGLPNALYFDGNISRLYAPELGRNDTGFPLGPIIGTIETE